MNYIDSKEAVQMVRLADVLLIGPFMVYVGTRRELPSALRTGLVLVGIGTILYNGRNYLRLKGEV